MDFGEFCGVVWFVCKYRVFVFWVKREEVSSFESQALSFVPVCHWLLEFWFWHLRQASAKVCLQSRKVMPTLTVLKLYVSTCGGTWNSSVPFSPWALTTIGGGPAAMLTHYPMGLSDFKGVFPHAKTVDSLIPDFGNEVPGHCTLQIASYPPSSVPSMRSTGI